MRSEKSGSWVRSVAFATLVGLVATACSHRLVTSQKLNEMSYDELIYRAARELEPVSKYVDEYGTVSASAACSPVATARPFTLRDDLRIGAC